MNYLNSKSIAVLGAGNTGKDLLDFLLNKNHYQGKIMLYVDNDLDNIFKQYLLKKGVEVLIGQDNFTNLKKANLIILSPGFNGKEKRFDFLRESGIDIISEIEFASSFINNDKIIAITGSNGKSTTVTLLYNILKDAGFNVLLAGNIGTSFISFYDKFNDCDFIVLEISSYQLEEIKEFRPKIAIILNITPDHLGRYGDLKSYALAKYRIFANQKSDDIAILNKKDSFTNNEYLCHIKSDIKMFSLKDSKCDVFYEEDKEEIKIRLYDKIVALPLKNIKLKGLHNVENIMVASLTSLVLNVALESLIKSVVKFQALEHRMELVSTISGVDFINDSKATNVDSALKAISSFEDNLVPILGGKGKGSSYKELCDCMKLNSKKVLLIGEDAPIIAKDCKEIKEKLLFIKNIEEAVLIAFETLKDIGGTVLLSPACASFDMFKNFEHRGNVFKQAVYSLKGVKN